LNAPRAAAPATTTRILDGAAFRIAAWMLAVALVVLPVVAVVNGWIGAQRWPLRTLRVEG
jgi:cell division septal protein FtsQ